MYSKSVLASDKHARHTSHHTPEVKRQLFRVIAHHSLGVSSLLPAACYPAQCGVLGRLPLIPNRLRRRGITVKKIPVVLAGMHASPENCTAASSF